VTAGRRAAAATRALAATAVLAALAAGLPWLMWHVTGWPLPHQLPGLATLKTGLTSRESPRVILDAVTCTGWVIWAVFVAQVAAETAWQLAHLPELARTGQARGRGPGSPSPPRALAAVLIGAVLIGIIAAARGVTPPAAAPTAPRLPAPAAATLTASQRPGQAPVRREPDSYTVREGDNLWDIAAAHLGSGEDWHQIWELNKYRPQPGGGELTTPGLIQPGWVLRMPARGASDPATSSRPRHTAEPAHHPAAHRAPSRPDRSRSPDHTPRHREAAHGAGQPHTTAGISLPSGGMAGAGLAAAITAGLALAAVHRRRRYRPGRVLTSRLDPAAPPLPPPVAALRRAHLAANAASDDDDDPYAAAPAVPAAAPAPLPAPAQVSVPPEPAGSLPLGIRDGIQLAADLSTLGGLGLTGPGAPAAARAILAGLLSRTLPGSRAAPADVIIPASDAKTLLPGYDQDEPGADRLPGLTITPALSDALNLAEETIIRRARRAGGHDLSDDADGTRQGLAPLPPAALIATPAPGASRRLSAIIRAGREVSLAAVLLGEWPGGTTCEVSADGTATCADPSLDGSQLFNLTADDTSAIVSILREARGASPPSAVLVPASPPQGRLSPDHPAAPPPAEAHGVQARETASAPPPSGPARQAPAVGVSPPPVPSHAVPPAVPAIRIEVLGPLRILVRGSEIDGGLRKARELAALLALHPDGLTGEAISEALWPGVPRSHGTAQRGLALRKLREMLRDAAGITTPRIVVLAAGRYRLDPTLVTTDVADFQAALEAARASSGEAGRLAACRTATALYRGPLADGAGYEWAEPWAETARRRALDAWTRIAEILQPAEPDQALAALEAALGHDPYNEQLYQKIMHVQAAAGRPDAVRRTLALLESRLTEIGVTPGSQTRQAAAALLGAPGHPAQSAASATR
jgi:DNA-binding SARP family transcriptional activator